MKQVVAAIMVCGDEILICQRAAEQSHPLKWEFPGGKIEPGEQPTDALRRELDEELGIRATIGRRLAVIRHSYADSGAVELHFYLVEKFDGQVQNRIFNDVRWVARKALPTYDFLEADLGLVNDIAAGKLL